MADLTYLPDDGQAKANGFVVGAGVLEPLEDLLGRVGEHVNVVGIAIHVRCTLLCFVDGLAMPLRTVSPEVYRRWIDHVIEKFGVDRCMFASNFPVDGLMATYAALWTAFDEITADFTEADRRKLFHDNAVRLYRL